MKNNFLNKLVLVCLLLIATIPVFAQLPPPPPPPCTTPPCNVPINSGVIFLIAAGLLFGVYALYGMQKKKAL